MDENLILADDLTMIGKYRKLKDYTNNSGPRRTTVSCISDTELIDWYQKAEKR